LIEVEDDGVGMGESRTPSGGVARKGTGIGMKNVRERLEVLYGETARFDVTSRPGRGTRVSLEIPVMMNENGDPVLAATPGLRTQPAARVSTST
jgi:two-component system LytT family sensor kinase